MKTIKFILLAILAVCGLYLLLLKFPEPFFSRSVDAGNLRIYFNKGHEEDVSAVAERALNRLKKSALYNEKDHYRVFLAGSDAEFAMYTNVFRNAGGFYNVVGNAFIRPSVPEKDRLIKPDGSLTEEDRPLHYFVAHEASHAMTHDRIGVIRYFMLPEWIREGVAESVARINPSFEKTVTMNVKSPADLDGHGGYLRYKLRIEYLMRVKGLDVFGVLGFRGNVETLDKEIDAYSHDRTAE
jgi:hypothetical protein